MSVYLRWHAACTYETQICPVYCPLLIDVNEKKALCIHCYPERLFSGEWRLGVEPLQ